ncbi:hypothetical protein FRC18_010961 [Serendipita sp. 400]|nr:hypothetical protein FRC18_010961 [Serendipita sp. 400]
MIFGTSRQSSSLQTALCREFPDRFFLQKPATANAAFRLLKYRVPETDASIKIDILAQGDPTVEITHRLRVGHIVKREGFPVAPLKFLLYHKLLGWERRSESSLPHNQTKANTQDRNDIIDICNELYRRRYYPLRASYIGNAYKTNLERRAQSFVETYGDRERRVFRRIGFSV